jgi:hypothetical protein
MTRRLGFALLASAWLGMAGAATAGEFEDNMLRLTEHQPRAVVAVIHRLVECNRVAGGPSFDARSFRHASGGVRALRCDTVHGDERALRKRYARNSDVLSALSEAHSYRP